MRGTPENSRTSDQSEGTKDLKLNLTENIYCVVFTCALGLGPCVFACTDCTRPFLIIAQKNRWYARVIIMLAGS